MLSPNVDAGVEPMATFAKSAGIFGSRTLRILLDLGRLMRRPLGPLADATRLDQLTQDQLSELGFTRIEDRTIWVDGRGTPIMTTSPVHCKLRYNDDPPV